MNNILSPTLAEQMFKDRNVRIAITRQSHFLFFHFYFAHYVKYKTAPFQKEIFHLSEQTDVKNLFIVAFRGSGKSTIITTSYPIWAILGEQEKKFVLIICQTRTQAKQHMMNLKRELESNQLLKNDLGPFQEESDEWGSSSLVFSNLNARITAASSEQSIRGIRHHQYRPEIIICDDVEDLASVKTRESRQKTYQWLTGEVIPAGDRNTRLVIVGNLLHEDSLIMRLKLDVEEKRIEGIFKAYPLLDQNQAIAWPGKYPNMESVEDEKLKSGNNTAWQREYLLRIVSDADRVIDPDWIQYYDSETEPWEDYHFIDYIGVDLAISEKSGADCTAIVRLKICNSGDKKWAYIAPHPFNKRIPFPEQVNQIKIMAMSLRKSYRYPKIFIEKVSYQESLVQQLRVTGIHTEGIPPHGDKRERLALTTAAIKEGLVKFPNKGAEELIAQLIGFGVEKHDDLADAFSLAVNQFIIFINKPIPRITYLL
ncbi:hypothetical protein KJ969_05645 [Patescibacteria group bacterium]|nr:hypothetical protein [Patescibacteria group bacterium]MBU2028835.1 hypothetical protein [Patescibacteria group bacterium]